MTTTISFADWVDWLAIELTFVELYESAPPALKHEMTTTVRIVWRVPKMRRAIFVLTCLVASASAQPLDAQWSVETSNGRRSAVSDEASPGRYG